MRSRSWELVQQLTLLSVVTSIALNTTLQQRWSRVRHTDFALQRDTLARLRAELGRGVRDPTSVRGMARQLARVGLRPSDFGFTSKEALEIERAMVAWHRPLTWFEVLFRGKKPIDPEAVPEIGFDISDEGASMLT